MSTRSLIIRENDEEQDLIQANKITNKKQSSSKQILGFSTENSCSGTFKQGEFMKYQKTIPL